MGNDYGGHNNLTGEYRGEQEREDEPTDIRADLEDVFKNDLHFEWSVYSSQTYRTTSLRPALADMSRTTQHLRNILLSWTQNIHSKDSPEKVVCLLQHHYSHADYRGSLLKGSDARAVAILESLAEELGFRLGLALVECHLQGAADDELNGHYSSDNESYSSDLDYSFDNELDSGDLDFLEIHESTIKIRELVNLEGTLLKKKLKLTEEDEDGAGAEFIPADLRRVVETGPHDQQEYECYGPGSLERWYRHTVLVIWPKQHDEQILHGTNYTRFLLDTLASTSSGKPTEADEEILEYALGLPLKEPKMTSVVLRGVCKVACAWKSSELWCRAIEVCDGSEFIDKVGKKLYLKGLLYLDPRTVLPCIRQVLQRDPKNVTRLAMLEYLAQRLNSREDLIVWVEAARRGVLASLRPLTPNDCDLVLDAVASLGGIADLERIVLPQLRDGADVITLVAFGTAIHQEINKSRTRILVSPGDTSLACNIIHDLLTLSVERAQLFTPMPSRNASQYYPDLFGQTQPTLDLSLALVKACITTHNDLLICRIANKLTPFAPADQGPLAERRIRAEAIYIPLVKCLQDFVERGSFSPGRGLQLMYGKVLPLMLDKPNPNATELALMMRVANQCSDLDDLIQSIISQFSALPREITTVKAFVRELRDLMTERPSLREELEPFITRLIKAMIRSLQPDNLRGQVAIMKWLDYCADTDNIDACSEVISQVTQDASSANGTRLTLEFLPFLPTLMSWLSRRGKPFTDQPYPLLFRTVILRWLQTVLGTTKLADIAQKLVIIRNCRCACGICAQVMRWLAEPSKNAAMSLYYIGTPKVNHLKANLREYASKVADWTVVRTSPQGIEIFKKSRIHRAQMRSTNQAAGLAALRAISADESALVSIFGEEVYKMAIQMLEVPYINADIGPAAPEDGPSGTSNPTQMVSEGASRPRGNSSVQPPLKRRRVDENVQAIELAP